MCCSRTDREDLYQALVYIDDNCRMPPNTPPALVVEILLRFTYPEDDGDELYLNSLGELEIGYPETAPRT